MDVHKARAFLAVAEELHFGRAAERLHIAQPPLSRAIRMIERELGTSLFTRSSRGVALTPVGEALVQPARDLVQQSERITQIARRAQQGRIGQVRIGFAGASVSSVVGALTARARRNLPQVHLALHGTQLSHAGMERLHRGELDAVIGRWDTLPPDVESRVLASEELVVALPPDHRLTAFDTIPVAELAEEAWVDLPGGNGATLPARLHALGRRGGFMPHIVETASDSATQLLLVDAGAGLALVFSGVRANFPVHRVAFRPVTPGLGAVEVRLAWRVGTGNPALAALIAELDRPTPTKPE